jgi:hypothetical protein
MALKVPIGHNDGAPEPITQYEPGGQICPGVSQWGQNKPAGQIVVMFDDPAEQNRPPSQHRHVALDVAFVTFDIVPAGQRTGAVAPTPLQVPGGELRQLAKEVPTPDGRNVPATQGVQFPDAASDQVPCAQVVQLADPLPENVDAGHARHVCAFIDGL